MWTSGYNLEPSLRNEPTETLLLVAVLGQHSMKEYALAELKRRKALRDEDDFSESFMTNLSGIC